MTFKLTQIIILVFLTAGFAAAREKPSIRICIVPLENHSTYPLPLDKLEASLALQLGHKHIEAVNVPGHDLSTEMASNNCEYLLSGEFSNFTATLECPNCPVIDERKHFALQFGFALRKTASDQPVYSHKSAVVDKNPKTCADDHIWETVRFVHDYFKKAGKASGG
jgi:hypothetical protein